MDLEVVVGRQERDGVVDFLVVQNLVGDRIQDTSCTPRLGNLGTC
jgi:hypothetical protein